MDVLLFGLKYCDSCRKARKWLDAAGVEYAFVDVRDETPAVTEIRNWLIVVGDALLNRRGTTWRQLPDADKTRADRKTELPKLLHEHPALMKRPVLIVDNQVHVGFDDEAWTGILKS